MDLRNTPMQEQFLMLTYLNNQIKNTGSYIYQYLKTKNQYQISFVNRSVVIPKFLSDCPMGCLKDAIEYLAEEFKKEKNIDFIDSYMAEKDNEFLKIKVANLEREIEELKRHQDGSYLGTWDSDHLFEPLIDEDFGEEKKERGRPKRKSQNNKELKKQADRLTEPTHLEKLLVPFPEVEPEFSYDKTEVKKRVERKNGKNFTEEEIYKDILRVNKGKNKLGRVIKTIEDVRVWAKEGTLFFEKERKKAYNRLYNKMYKKIAQKLDKLDIGENKHGITKDDVLKNMQDHLGIRYGRLSKVEYLAEWNKAKSRVWGKYYRKRK